jgi:hypothetical protein
MFDDGDPRRRKNIKWPIFTLLCGRCTHVETSYYQRYQTEEKVDSSTWMEMIFAA